MDTDINALSTPDEILGAALAKEREAYEFYSGLLDKPHATIVRRLLEKLKDEEYKHFRAIENMLSKMNSGRDIL